MADAKTELRRRRSAFFIKNKPINKSKEDRLSKEPVSKEVELTTSCNVLPCQPLRLFLLTLLCLAFGIAHYKLVSTIHENHIHFSHLSTLERELFFRTEMGFYYSFFKQIIEAPTFVGGFNLLLHDNITEFPDRINSLERFNLYPEVIIGGLFRLFRATAKYFQWRILDCYSVNRGSDMPPVTSCDGLGEPAYFYCEAVFWLAGGTLIMLCLLSWLASGGSFCAAIITSIAFFYNHRECTRVQWTPPLRESFSFPLLVMQQVALTLALRKSSTPRLFFLTVSTLAFMLPWQFAQFALLTQAYAVFGAFLLNLLTAQHLRRIVLSLLVAHCLNFMLQFGNRMLLTGFFPAALCAMLIVSFMSARLKASFISLNYPLRFTCNVFLLLTGTLIVRFMLLQLFGHSDDAHITDILLSKFTSHRTFDTQLYTCSPEFDFYDVSSLTALGKTLILPAALLAMILVSVQIVFSPSGRRELGAVTVYLILQMCAFAVMAALIMRLKLFFTPQLCLTAGLLFHQHVLVWPKSNDDLSVCEKSVSSSSSFARRSDLKRGIVFVLLLLGMTWHGYSNVREEVVAHGEYSNWPMEQLVNWITKNTQLNEAFGGPMSTMATIRLCTARPIVNHPHYEDANLRNRTRQIYLIYSRRDVDQVWQVYRDLNITWMLFEKHWCSARSRHGCGTTELFDLTERHLLESGKPPLCVIFRDQPHLAEPYFEKHFDNGVAALFRVKS